jgi:hypothetical protein
MALLGFLLGFLVLLRYTGALTGIAIALLLLGQRQWRTLFLSGVIAGCIVLPQLAYNAAFFGSPFETGYTAIDTVPPHGLFSLNYIGDAVTRLSARFGPLAILLLVGIVLGIGILLTGVQALARLGGRWPAAAAALWIGGYLALYLPYYYAWTGSLIRLLMPMYPAVALVCAAALVRIAQRRRSFRASRPIQHENRSEIAPPLSS